MLICNMKINSKVLFKIVFVILFILVIIMSGIGIYKIFTPKGECVSNSLTTNNVNIISSSNYTNVFKRFIDFGEISDEINDGFILENNKLIKII